MNDLRRNIHEQRHEAECDNAAGNDAYCGETRRLLDLIFDRHGSSFVSVENASKYMQSLLIYHARCSACQMRWLVVGISICVTPSGVSASSTALTIAGKAPTVPASPAPLAPKGLSLVGHGLLSTLIAARSSARGIA